MSTAQQSLVTVTVAGRALGKFASRTGGESTAEPQKDFPGGMAKANVYPSLPNVGDVVVSRVRANTAADIDLVAWLRTQAGSGQMVVSDQPLDAYGIPFGKPETWTGVLTGVVAGDSDANSTDLRRLELTMTCTEVS